jgi:AAA ATPase containing von Willebrand factor type A (vWA) domain
VKTPSSASSSVKMVLKDGVLQAKPKQRRYRTERPFFCEHCSGRFTLRSNMERHIKQQHPQFWIQKQRGGSSGSRRGHPYKLLSFSERGDNKIMPLVPGFNPTGSNGFDDINHYGKTLPNFGNNEGLKSISDEVRIAISLQLKNKVISNEENGKYYENMKSSDSLSDHFRRSEHKEEMSRMEQDFESHERNDDTGNEDYDEEDEEEEEEEEELIIDETSVDNNDNHSMNGDVEEEKAEIEDQTKQSTKQKEDNGALDLASVSRLLDNASTQTFRQFFHDEEEHNHDGSDEDEEGLVAGSNSEGNGSGSDENR